MDPHIGPITCGSNLLAIELLMFNHTLSPSSKFTSHRDLSVKSLYHLCAFSKLALAISHKHRLSSSSCVTINTSSLASLWSRPCEAQDVGTIGDLLATI
jgi:hypothetical protein